MVCPRCFAAARLAFAANYRAQHFGFVVDVDVEDPGDVGLRWRELALTLLAGYAELESTHCALCAGHGGASETLRERCSKWIGRYAEMGFANIAALAVMGAITLDARELPIVGKVRNLVEWLRERSAGGAHFH